MAEPTTNEHARRRPAASAEVLGNNESGHRDRAVRTRQRDSEYRIGGNCQKIDVSPADAIWVTNAYQFAVVISLLPLASLGDIFGYRRIYVIGLTVFTAAALVSALSHSLAMLTLGRALQGFGAAASRVSIRRWYALDTRAGSWAAVLRWFRLSYRFPRPPAPVLPPQSWPSRHGRGCLRSTCRSACWPCSCRSACCPTTNRPIIGSI
jgi:hypothetical protein